MRRNQPVPAGRETVTAANHIMTTAALAAVVFSGASRIVHDDQLRRTGSSTAPAAAGGPSPEAAMGSRPVGSSAHTAATLTKRYLGFDDADAIETD
jgi:hypothetical protein